MAFVSLAANATLLPVPTSNVYTRKVMDPARWLTASASRVWVYPTMLNGWVAGPSGPVRYAKRPDGFVETVGSFVGGVPGAPAFRYEEGYRPDFETVSSRTVTRVTAVGDLIPAINAQYSLSTELHLATH